MMRLAEISVFFAAASALHVAAWLAFPQDGTQSAGATGQETLSLAAASGEISDLAEAWLRPVEVTVTPRIEPGTAVPAESTLTPVAQAAPNRPALPQPPATLPAVLRQPDPLPSADTTPATPTPPDTGPVTSVRPQSRPAAAPVQPPEPAKTANPRQAPATQPQTASGDQTGQNAGQTQAQAPATQSSADRQSLMAQWGAAIRSSVERRKAYPRGTKARGTAKLHLTVSRQGRLLNARVIASSGDAALDGAALAAVKRARYPSAPSGLDQPQYQFNLPVSFK